MQSSSGRYSVVKNEVGDINTFTSVIVKAEPVETGVHGPPVYETDNLKDAMVKKEYGVSDEFDEDELDHMLLKDRLKLLAQGLDSQFKSSGKLQSPEKLLPSGTEQSSIMEPAEPICIKRFPRKRKKSATDSIEKALEEDAPGLLRVLIDKGVLADEIKLYGSKESDDAVDDSSDEDSFAELESVMSKLSSQRPSFIKFPSLQSSKSSKAAYCLPCLLALIEQSRYLVFRNWPVEWGWCRDLQAFIFVFQKHNRIVLERPEYGYATYFFELVNSSPISWQIKRLVISMKLTSCSRISLVENKAFSVGEDLSEGEAKVLTEFGWIPNTGLGTMLNYCGRVFHDRQNEKDGSEWKSKISRLLIDGYAGGSIISSCIAAKNEDGVDLTSQVKLEPS